MMTEVTTKRIITRLGTGLFSILIVLILGAIISNQNIDSTHNLQKTFLPERVTKQTVSVYEALLTPISESKQLFPCSERSKLYLTDLISAYEGINYENSVRRLNQTWEATVLAKNSSCTSFPFVLNTAYKTKSEIKNGNTEPETFIKSMLAQNISWNASVFCMYANINQNKYLIGKPNAQCLGANPSVRPNDDQQLVINRLAPILRIAENRRFRLPEGSRLDRSLGLDFELQVTLDKYLQNLDSISFNSKSDQLKFAKNLRTAAIVILDADTSKLVAVACLGEDCNKKEQANLGLFAGTSIEAPPASTAKLLYALSIAELSKDTADLLPLEIKTSGQLDHQVSKRNEWWEKQVICDDKKTSVCKIPITAANWASDLGLNINCEPNPSLKCGRSSLFSSLGIPEFNPALGRLLVNYSKQGPTLDKNNLTKTFLKWNDYEALRRGELSNHSASNAERTSLVVQSVIGAGNNRVTALGLAQLSAGIYQAATKGVIYNPTIFDSDPVILTNSVNKTSPKIVLKGMQKVIQPAEKKWVGDGTARAAFVRSFGFDCSNDCPLYAKTGTVSTQDSVYAGTTLLTAIVRTDDLSVNLLGLNSSKKKNLALGIIFRPKKPGGPHYASNLGMGIIKAYVKNNRYENNPSLSR
jgi:hypothetical protein